jgi:hypothetical protein
VAITCIEPRDERLRSRLKERDLRTTTLLASPVQDVPLATFDELAENDILFVDSSPVGKVGSDVNHILFRILPRLAPGVYVHFHDVFFPFEHPQEWLDDRIFWNEGYGLHAFLQYDSAFEIVVWDQLLATFFAERMQPAMPLCLRNPGGSLWIRRC